MIKITPIPALESNYFWVIQPDPNKAVVLVVDPGDAKPVIDYLNRHSLKLQAILVTHRHNDHTGGINELLEHHPVTVYGPQSAAIPQINAYLEHDDQLDLLGLSFRIIAVPGHTWEHIAYYLPTSNVLFCGDALFAGGCGKRFDGTAEIMWESLQNLAALPDETLVYCAHEYTLPNLRFAIAAEPDNIELMERFHQVETLRQQGRITLPSTILLEKRTNPFLRCQEAGIKSFIRQHSVIPLKTAADAFGALRSIKDSWPN